MEQIRTFVVSLKTAAERRQLISSQFEKLNLNFEFFDAFWGKDYYDNPAYFDSQCAEKLEKRVLKPGEVGCALSHLEIYKTMLNENLPYVLIIEDDALISEDISQVVQQIISQIKPFDLITLCKCDIYSKKNKKSLYKNYELVKPKMIKYGSICQTAGYIITKEAAKIILDFNFPVKVPADSWGYYEKKINFYGVIPSRSLIKQNYELESSIVNGIRHTEKKSTVFSLLFYRFYTRNPIGILLKSMYKRIFK